MTQLSFAEEITVADDERSMPATIGMWVENFEEYTLNMTCDEFGSVIADTKWLLEKLREARGKSR